MCSSRLSLPAIVVLAFCVAALAQAPLRQSSNEQTTASPAGYEISSELCGACHQAIYREFEYGFGADIRYPGMVLRSSQEPRLHLPANVSAGATAHATAGVDLFPIHARDVEEEGRSCDVCHYPQAFAIPPIAFAPATGNGTNVDACSAPAHIEYDRVSPNSGFSERKSWRAFRVALEARDEEPVWSGKVRTAPAKPVLNKRL